MEDCSQIIKLDPVSAQAHYALGRLYEVLDKKTEAIDAYKKAIQLKPDLTDAHLFLGIAYAGMGKHYEAIKSYKEAILTDRYYPEAHVFLGMSYDETKQYSKAIASFEEAFQIYSYAGGATKIHSLGIKPDFTNVYCAIGICRLKLDQPYEASVAFKKAIEIDGNHSGAHYGLALSALLLGDKKTAVAECEAVKAIKGQDAAKPILDIINKAGQ
jgi:tetratricopeptide (TPR) repeat protein